MQGENPRRRLAERTIDYGIAAMDYCETLPHGALVGLRPSVSATSCQPSAASVKGRFNPLLLVTDGWQLVAVPLREADRAAAFREAACTRLLRRVDAARIVGAYADDKRQHQHGQNPQGIAGGIDPRGVGGTRARTEENGRADELRLNRSN